MPKKILSNNVICLIAILLIICILNLGNNISITNNNIRNIDSFVDVNTSVNMDSIEESTEQETIEEPTLNSQEQELKLEEPMRFANMFRENLNYLDVNDIVNFMQYNPKVNKINREKENSLNGGYLYNNIVGFSNGNCYSSESG
tara:strand:+ start:82 stop:513 length:432 start_codon:yes stop_codon:yes gene_type:complete